MIVIVVLLLSGDIDLSDLEHARLIAASEVAPERNKNCTVLSCISGCFIILATFNRIFSKWMLFLDPP
ncbi:MAG TPA: hypothetical protein VLB68_19590, partial [Pyrinomonadaceae bacterium]|nr:hypothetical protein [Pyrinomonadaceae bacterium]